MLPVVRAYIHFIDDYLKLTGLPQGRSHTCIYTCTFFLCITLKLINASVLFCATSHAELYDCQFIMIVLYNHKICSKHKATALQY